MNPAGSEQESVNKKGRIREKPCKENGYHWVIDIDEDLPLSIHAHEPGHPPYESTEVGDEGVLVYVTGPNYGLYFWNSTGAVKK